MNTQGPTAEMPRYKCHKEVWAFKIKKIIRVEMPQFQSATCRGSAALGTACGSCERCEWDRIHPVPGATIVPEESQYLPFTVDREYLTKHQPIVGGYYVVYKDGYKSFSPAKEFEDGYTLLGARSK